MECFFHAGVAIVFILCALVVIAVFSADEPTDIKNETGVKEPRVKDPQNETIYEAYYHHLGDDEP